MTGTLKGFLRSSLLLKSDRQCARGSVRRVLLLEGYVTGTFKSFLRFSLLLKRNKVSGTLFSIIGKMDSVKQEIRVMLLRSSGDRRVSKRSKRSITRRVIK